MLSTSAHFLQNIALHSAGYEVELTQRTPQKRCHEENSDLPKEGYLYKIIQLISLDKSGAIVGQILKVVK